MMSNLTNVSSTPTFCEQTLRKHLNYTFVKQHCGVSSGTSITASLVFAAFVTSVFIIFACICYFGEKDLKKRRLCTIRQKTEVSV